MNKKIVLILIIIVTILLSACNSRADQAALATAQVEMLCTSVAETANAMQTHTAFANPTATPSLTPTMTETPLPATNTPIPTLPAVATTAPINAGGTTSSACDAAAFISETIPDNTIFAPGATFTKTWTIQNTGTCTWSTAYTLVHHSEQLFGANESNVLSTVAVAPGSSIQVTLNMTAPTTEGTYYSHWVLANASSQTFMIGGTTLWAKIVVSSTGATSAPTSSTATITPTTFGTVVYTSTPVVNTQATAVQATINSQSTISAAVQATNAQATLNAQATINAQATLNAQATAAAAAAASTSGE
jgi:hypothetical protein